MFPKGTLHWKKHQSCIKIDAFFWESRTKKIFYKFCFAEQNYLFSSLFSFISYLETTIFSEKWREKSEELRVQKETTTFCRKLSFLFDDPYGIRTHVIAVKGRCLNHLTKGPCIWALLPVNEWYYIIVKGVCQQFFKNFFKNMKKFFW